jgi:hypothetical protein
MKQLRCMKKLLPCFILFLPLLSKGQASVYHPFPDSNAVWRQFTAWYDAGCNCYPCRDYQVYINGDTIINSVTYKSLYWSGTWGPGFCDWAVFSTGSPYVAYRESNKQIWLYHYDLHNEELLYDFNLNVGDTLTTLFSQIIISQVDSILVGSTYRKNYYCSAPSGPSNYMSIIEGIGSTYGMIWSLGPNWQEMYNELICFKQNNQDLFPENVNCTLVDVNVPEIQSQFFFSISPNPASLKQPITFTYHPTSSHQRLTIYNANGAEAGRYALLPNSNKTEIKLHEMASGLYVARLVGEGVSACVKFVME